MVTGINGGFVKSNIVSTTKKDTKSDDSKVNNKDEAFVALGKDTFEKSEEKESLTYSNAVQRKTAKDSSDKSNSNGKVDIEEVNRLIQENEKRQEEFKNLIKSLIAEQGESYNVVILGQKLNVTPEVAKKAEEAVSDGGEYSVDSVATNIMSMAKALSGGDSSKIEELRDGFIKGYKEAEKAWGGELPDISKQTYDEVMKRFYDWKNESNKEE